jgi:hypothetical protein
LFLMHRMRSGTQETSRKGKTTSDVILIVVRKCIDSANDSQ